MKKPESICLFGDSTPWGAWDLERGGWVNRLWLHLAHKENEYTELYNLSTPGGGTDLILKRFENEAIVRNADALIFQSGGNDASRPAAGENRIPVEQFEKNLNEIINKARKITQNIIFIGFKNCDETKTTPVSWADIHYLNADLTEYDAVMRKVCDQQSVPYCDIADLPTEDFYDGIHPTSLGHEKIFVQVRDFLTAHGWI